MLRGILITVLSASCLTISARAAPQAVIPPDVHAPSAIVPVIANCYTTKVCRWWKRPRVCAHWITVTKCHPFNPQHKTNGPVYPKQLTPKYKGPATPGPMRGMH